MTMCLPPRSIARHIGALLALLLALNGAMVRAADSLTLNMRDADIRALIQWVADNTGRNIIVHKDVEGSVTVLSNTPLSPDEAYQVFLSVLEVHGFAAIETDEAIKVVPKSMATGGGLPFLGKPDQDMVVSVVKVQNVSADKLATIVRPLMSREAVITPYGATNTLVMADHARNIQSARRLISELDSAGDTEIEVIRLQHASAVDVMESISALIPPPSGEGDALALQVSMDERSNSILVSGDPAKRRKVRALVAKLDKPLFGEGNTQVLYLNYVDAKEVKPILDGLAKSIQQQEKDTSSISIETSESANALVINAPPAMLNTMRSVVSQLDIRRAQVLVEALVVEVSGDVAEDFGVTWISTNADGLDDGGVAGAVNTLGDLKVAEQIPTGVDGETRYGPAKGLTFGYFEDGNIQAAVRMLEANANTNILSTPTVVAIDNEEASLLVGQNVPFKTGQSTGSASSTADPFVTIERQDIGISLKITPRINQGDSITLEIEQTTESIAPSVETASDIITNKREIITKALIKDGEILVLGGLISNEQVEVQEKVPFLGDLPLMGALFRSTGTSNTKKNLMVFIHPVILKDEEHIAEVTQRRYNFMKKAREQASGEDWEDTVRNPTSMQPFETFSPVGKDDSQ